MIDKAFGLQEAVRNAVYNDYTRALAGRIVFEHLSMTEEELSNAVFDLLGHLASQTAYEATLVLLDENQQGELSNTIDMLNEMENN